MDKCTGSISLAWGWQGSTGIELRLDLRLVCATLLRDHFAHATVAQHFQAYEGKPLHLPAEAAGPKPEYLEYHRTTIFEKYSPAIPV